MAQPEVVSTKVACSMPLRTNPRSLNVFPMCAQMSDTDTVRTFVDGRKTRRNPIPQEASGSRSTIDSIKPGIRLRARTNSLRAHAKVCVNSFPVPSKTIALSFSITSPKRQSMSFCGSTLCVLTKLCGIASSKSKYSTPTDCVRQKRSMRSRMPVMVAFVEVLGAMLWFRVELKKCIRGVQVARASGIYRHWAPTSRLLVEHVFFNTSIAFSPMPSG
eukprot:2367129-Rhodomonas_salina.3